jgi:capsular exopolysaccharide synthesis family protein
VNARDYLTVLREKWLTIVGCVVVCLVIAGGVTLVMPKSYWSSTTFYVVAGTTVLGQQNPTSDLYQGAQLAKDRVKSYSELISGPRVAQDAATALGGGATAASIQSKLTVSSVEDTVILTLTAADRTPQGSVDVVTAVSNAFVRVVDQLETRPGGAGPMVTVQVVQPPVLPAAPVTPRLSLNLIIGLLVGLVLGFGIAIARRSMDVSVRSAEELEAATEAAVLGVVPDDPASATPAISLATSRAGGVTSRSRAEAFRRIRTNLEFSDVDVTNRVLVVTSALPDEGKTTSACDLAAALAAVGHRVVLVEGDLRRPAAAALLGLDNAVGLSTVLTGKIELDRALQSDTLGGFDVLAGGRTPPRPNEMLASRRAASLIGELRQRYEFVIIDSPPILPVADAVNLGTHADGAIVVCRWASTSRADVVSAVAALRAVSVPVVGTILSRARGGARAPWKYYGTYGGGEFEQEPNVAARDLSYGLPAEAASEHVVNGVGDSTGYTNGAGYTNGVAAFADGGATQMLPSSPNGHRSEANRDRPSPSLRPRSPRRFPEPTP